MLPDKYIDLAGQNPTGVKLLREVEQEWQDWLNIVRGASWLRYYAKTEPGCSPMGVQQVGPESELALQIFSSAVWGFGLEKWLSTKGVYKPMYPYGQALDINLPSQTIMRLRQPRVILKEALWDLELHTSTRMLIPSEYVALDCWLEPLYQNTL